MTYEMRQKLSLFCNVPVESVIEECDVETSIYELPLLLKSEDLDDIVLDHLGLEAPEDDMKDWHEIVRRLKAP
jgi:CTP synthase